MSFLQVCKVKDVDTEAALQTLNSKYKKKYTCFRAVLNELYRLNPEAYMDVLVLNFDQMDVLKLGIYTTVMKGFSPDKVLKELGDREFRLDSKERIDYAVPLLNLPAETDRILEQKRPLLWPLLSENMTAHQMLLTRIEKLLNPSLPTRKEGRKSISTDGTQEEATKKQGTNGLARL